MVVESSISGGYATVGTPYLSLSAGKFYFEVEVLEAKGFIIVGVAGTNFGCGKSGGHERAVGGDNMSWGAYAGDGEALHGCATNNSVI